MGQGALDDSTITFNTSEGVLAWAGTVAGPGLNARGSLEFHGDQAYQVRADLADFPLQGLHPEGADGSPIVALLSGKLDVDGHFGEQPSPVALDLRDGHLRMTWRGHELETTQPFQYTQDGLTFGVRDFELVGGKTRLAFGGQRTADGRVFFAGEGTLDLDLLRAVTSSVQEASGEAVVNVSVGGPVGSVVPVVDFALDGARFGTDWLPERFEDVVAHLTVRPDGVEIHDAKGRVGGGTWTLGGGFDSTS